MRLYKFRSLGTCEELERAQEILGTGEFWCARFWELNDPMEGVYWFNAGTLDKDFIRRLYGGKSDQVLCSFSGERAFELPVMWGYYANGFRGIAIEIEVDSLDIAKITYSCDVANIKNSGETNDAVRRILTTKLCDWQHEDEYRYLCKGESGLHKIGRITTVYFGNPYKTTVNAKDVQERPRIRQYLCRVKSLMQTAKKKDIDCRQVVIIDGRVQAAEPDAKDAPKS